MKYYFFNYTSQVNSSSYTVVFDCCQNLYKQELSRELKEFHTYHEQRRKTIYIYPDIQSRMNDDLDKHLEDVFNKPQKDIIVVSFNANGFNKVGSEVIISELIEHGILNIVKTRNAVLESDDSFHYVLPSEKHSPFFIRTGNILSNSEEVYFLCVALINEIKGKIFNQIACDTSSILALPFALNYVLGLFGKEKHIPISSFGSYSSIDEFDFKARTLVLISASNSGRLIKLVKERQKDIDAVTILLNSDDLSGQHLINLKSHLPQILNNNERKQFDNLKDCDYCKRNSIPVVVRGDHFMPSRILIQKVLITKAHVPYWVKVGIKNILYCKSIYAFRKESLSPTSKQREIFIDVENALKSNRDIEGHFNKFIRNHIPASTSIIISLPDRSSRYIAELIVKHLEVQGGIAKIITQNNIHAIDVNEEHLIVVVASCVTTGNKLNSLSRDLRDHNKASIHYISLINRLADSERQAVLKKNLEYRKLSDNNINRFGSVFDCFLGDYHSSLSKESDRPSWLVEVNFWKELNLSKQHSFISTRIEALEHRDGLQDNLFLPKINKAKLENLVLRKNFALVDVDPSDQDRMSQADLYIIIAAIFQYLRNPKYIKVDSKNYEEKFLVQHEHVKTIIDPLCFKRYNDGIIQAAFLRIATNSELNYSVSDRDSLDMLETLKDLFKDVDDIDLSEALLEFLYAIAIKKLRLKNHHLSEFINFIEERYGKNDIVILFLGYINSKLEDFGISQVATNTKK